MFLSHPVKIGLVKRLTDAFPYPPISIESRDIRATIINQTELLMQFMFYYFLHVRHDFLGNMHAVECNVLVLSLAINHERTLNVTTVFNFHLGRDIYFPIILEQQNAVFTWYLIDAWVGNIFCNAVHDMHPFHERTNDCNYFTAVILILIQ